MFRFLKRVFRESFSLHLVVPLIVSILVGSAFGYWQGRIATMPALYHFWAERLPELLAIYSTFVVVLVFLIWRETAVRVANMGILDDALRNSQGYFSFGVIPLNEWFDPSVQVYLARIVAQQQRVAGYRYQRVLLFIGRGDLEAAHASYLDEYDARCLIRIHQLYGISLAFLRRHQLFKILEDLTVAERKALRCYPRAIAALPDWMLGLVRLPWICRRIPTLAFAVVTYEGDRSTVIRFSKERRMLDIGRVESEADKAPHLRLVQLVRDRIHRDDGTLLPEYDFAEHMAI